jgi:hypothetical protein
MTILTGRELEVLTGLQMSWGKLYSKELARLQNKDDSKCAIDPSSHTPFPARALKPMAIAYRPNLGFEQKVGDSFACRIGLDETSPTAGITYRFSPFKLDIAYVRDLAKARVGDLFGTNSNSLLATLTFDFAKEAAKTKSAAAGGGDLPAAKVLR